MMLKAVVIDDQPSVRQALIKLIPWDSYPCEVMGEAGDGEQAKAILVSVRPDIVIADIRMPKIDGLALTEWINANVEDCCVILITGYQEFKYAQKALELGVYAIISKPIRYNELGETIRLAAQELLAKRVKRSEWDRVMKEKHFSALLDGRIDTAAEQAVNLSAKAPRFMLALVKPVQRQAVREVTLEKGQRKQDVELEGMLSDQTHPTFYQWYKLQKNDDTLYLFLYDNDVQSREHKSEILKVLAAWQEIYKRDGQSSASVVVSSFYKSFERLGDAYTELMELKNKIFFQTDNGQAHPPARKRDQPITEHGKLMIINVLETFQDGFETKSEEELADGISHMLAEITAFSKDNVPLAKSLISELCFMAVRKYYRTTGNELGLPVSVEDMLRAVERLDNMNQAMEYVSRLFIAVREELTRDTNDYGSLVRSVMKHIHEHYAKELSLQGVAEQYSVNPSYLSRLLKKETGKNFVDIIAGTRIHAAKKLLRDPSSRVNEVGEKVGYQNYTYFYQIFKKYEGISPKEFKNNS
ncbi:response regulator transcription factor [Paenibacillus luteus]|uniref:response regulator transcription factor n=1 Tax=Paenibacillus luteus TaxID=2545753 RepID=UPI0013758613|nr:response regulator [Paenibacillus luteus]